ncbi:MAG: pilus assembly protein [Firmicutes bacterium]|nr:pilus assembly protein [Bacillota bacterium]
MYLEIFLKRISDPSGSAIVEAALVFPLVVLLLAAILGLSLQILTGTEEDAVRHREEAREELEPKLLEVENVLRGVWLLDEEE